MYKLAHMSAYFFTLSQRRSAKVVARMQACQSLGCSHAKSMEGIDQTKR